jgi:hypothetical protein
VIQPGFDARASYFLALGHVAVALAVLREDQAAIARLASAIGEMVESTLLPEHETVIVDALK